jgi:heavy metal sensor kinase
MMFKSIRWTLQLWHAAILALALAGFGVALYFNIRTSQFDNVDREIEGAARVLGTRPLGPPGFRGGGPREGNRGHEIFVRENRSWGRDGGRDRDGGPPRPPSLADRLPWIFFDAVPELEMIPADGFGLFMQMDWTQDLPRDVLSVVGKDQRDQPYYLIWDREGMGHPSSDELKIDQWNLTDPEAAQWARPFAKAIFRWRYNGGLFREVMVPGPFGERVLVGRSVERERQDLRKLAWVFIGVGAGVLAIGLAGGWLLSSRAIRPIHTISETARSISASDLSRRIDVQDTQTELGELAETLNDTFDRLDKAFQRQVQFTADASHELRTPLAVIHSHAELALSRERTADEYRQTLEACLRASRRMKSLVESLLVLARSDAGRLELNPSEFDLKSAAEESVHMVEPLAKEKEVRIESELTPVEIKADRTRISQLITNLLSNAIRYNRTGGGVKLGVGRENGEAILTVADTGVGIPENDQHHVFERFFRADKARSREVGGSGLGLAICQSIVEAHGGTISFTSKPNEGTTFVVKLPVT